MKYKFFWKAESPFSNWHFSDFTYANHKFNCAEQAFMYAKARLFNDPESAKKILLEMDQRKQKNLGRLVKNFDSKIWDAEKYQLIKDILYCKFTQSESLRKELLKYKGYQFCEASPTDRIWGCGFEESNALENIDRWGENLLGKILTELSEEL